MYNKKSEVEMKKLFPYMKKYKWFILSIIVFIGLNAVSDLLLPTIMANIIDIGIIKNDLNYILKSGLYMILIALIGGVFSVATRFLAAKVSIEIGTDLRKTLFKKQIYLGFSDLDKFGISSLITRTTNDIKQIEDVLGTAFRFLFLAPLMFVSTLVIALSKDVSLTLLIMAGTLLLALFMAIVAKFAIPMFKKNQKLIDGLNLILRERFTGIRVIRAFDKTDFEKKKFEASSRDLQNLTTKVSKLLSTLSPAIQLMFSMLSIAVVYLGGIRVDSGNLQVGEMMSFLQYGAMLMSSMMMLVMVLVFIPRAQISIDRIMEVIDLEFSIEDKGEIDNFDAKGRIEFKNVSFYYAKDETDADAALEDVSLVFEAGKYNAIIGSTGSGKSSIIKLIERFYDINDGSIFIDGIDIKEYSNKALKQIISLSPQKTEIITGSIRENVDINGNLSDEEIISALKVAGAYEFVKDYEDGINHELNRAGTNLSGGQKQRISIARTIAKNSSVYIFDDSFSALDHKTETRVKEAIFEKLANKTVIVIAQKVDSIKNADNIVLLDEGRLIASGSHKELVENSSVYREIIESQKGGESYE